MAQAFLNGVQYNDPNTASIVQIIERTITEINIPEGVSKIGQSTFSNCDQLERVVLPEGVQKIDSGAFTSCTNLSEIDLPNSLKSCQGYVFSYCSNLKRLVLPPLVTTIAQGFVLSCKKLSEMVAQGPITYIGHGAFSGCTECLMYDFSACTSVPILYHTEAFTGINANCKIYVPASLYNEWIVATNWAEYANHIVPDIPVMEIPDYVSDGLEIEGNSVLGRAG